MRVEFNEANNNRPTRKHKRKSARFHVVAFILMVVLSAVIALCLTVWFHIGRIDVVGNSVYSAEEIIAASGIRLDDNLFRIDSAFAENNIKKTLPYINGVRVERKFPATVKLNVSPATEYAYIDQNAGSLIVDKNMKVLKEFAEPGEGVIHLKGTQFAAYVVGEQLVFSDTEQTKALNELFTNLDSLELNSGEFKVTMVDVSDVLDIKFILNDMHYIKIGSLNNINKKLIHLKTMFSYVDRTKSGIINLAGWTEENDQATFKYANISEFK